MRQGPTAAGYPAEPPRARTEPAGDHPPPRSSRSRTTIAVALGAALVVLVATVVVFRRAGEEDGPGLERTEAAPSVTATTEAIDPEADLPPADPTMQAEVAQLQEFVAEARGLEFVADVPVRLAGDDDYAALVAQFFQIDPAQVAADAAYYEALGLIPEGTAEVYVEELLSRVQSSLGFYDPASGVLIVRGGEIDAGVRSVVVHELVHALDDQWFELDRPQYEGDRTSEHVDSFPMVVEGDAERIRLEWLEEQSASDRAEAEEAVGDPRDTTLGGNADFVDFGLLAPYQVGTPFVSGLAAGGGERLVDAVILDPPDTTEQVLYPEVFDRREGRLPVPPPPADGPVIEQGVVGALFWRGLLTFADSDVTDGAADAAARGWGGDWEVTYLAEGLTCTRSDVEGDTPADTAELLDALTIYAEAHPDVTVAEADGRARMEVCYEVPIAGPDAR